MSETINIVCLKWGDKYPAEYVNRLYRMVKRHLQLPFSFYCLTENNQGLDSHINILELVVEPGVKGWWYKLQLFKPDFYGLQGQLLFLDLDVVIVGAMEPLFASSNASLSIINDLQPGKIYNSSVFKLEVGHYPEVWQRFQADKVNIMQRMHGDQDWISESVSNAVLWEANQIVSFKKQCNARVKRSFGTVGKYLRRLQLCLPKGNACCPETTIIVYFHGKPDPEDVADGPYDMWKQAPWIREAWR